MENKLKALAEADQFIVDNGGHFMGEIDGNRCFWVYKSFEQQYYFYF